MKQKIALFGGSFDPLHSDHLEIINECLRTLNFDSVWVIPTHLSPFKKRTYSSDEHRINMIKIAIKNIKNVEVKTFEIDKKESNTFKTVSHFIDEYPNIDFKFIMGSDQISSFDKWYNVEELKKKIEFIVFKRNDNFDLNIVKENGWELRTFNNKNVSSTKIRLLVQVDDQLEELNQYALENLLFVEDRLNLSKKRYEHSINVGVTAKALAEKYDSKNINNALIAGTLHDVAKELDEEELKRLLTEINPDLLKEPKQVWHSFAGKKILEEKWKITNDQILNAVFNHTVGNENMTTFDKIVFCADKISFEREYESLDQARRLVFKNLDEGFKFLLKIQYDVAVAKHGAENIGSILSKTYKKYID